MKNSIDLCRNLIVTLITNCKNRSPTRACRTSTCSFTWANAILFFSQYYTFFVKVNFLATCCRRIQKEFRLDWYTGHIRLQDEIANLAFAVTLLCVEYYIITDVYALISHIYFYDASFTSIRCRCPLNSKYEPKFKLTQFASLTPLSSMLGFVKNKSRFIKEIWPSVACLNV